MVASVICYPGNTQELLCKPEESKQGEPIVPQDRQKIIAGQSQFHRNNFRRLITYLFILIILAYVLLATVVYLQVTQPLPKFFVTTSDGRLIEIQPQSTD